MDAKLIEIIGRLAEDLANLEKALDSTKLLLRELARDARKNGRRLGRNDATKLFLANQQPRWGGTAPWHARLRRPGRTAGPPRSITSARGSSPNAKDSHEGWFKCRP